MAPPKGKGPATKVIFIKKKGKGHGHHGGAWKVAYADFVTAMMALFMVLWLVSQTDESTRSSLSHYFRTGVFAGSGHVIGDGLPSSEGPTPGGGTPRMSEAESLEEAAARIESALGLLSAADPDHPLGGNVSVTVTQDGLLIQITDGGDGLVFGLSSSDLTPSLEVFLQQIAPALGALQNDLQIHGHTDARPFPSGSSYDNWDLSFARADAARNVLEDYGVRPDQVVGVLAHGSSSPIEGSDPFAPENRRLSILAVRRGHEAAAEHGEPADDGAEPGPEATGPEGEPEGEPAEHPEAEHPEAEHPEAEHPEAEHPRGPLDHPLGEHPLSEHPARSPSE
jgi:chemotaxis protein MotB